MDKVGVELDRERALDAIGYLSGMRDLPRNVLVLRDTVKQALEGTRQRAVYVTSAEISKVLPEKYLQEEAAKLLGSDVEIVKLHCPEVQCPGNGGTFLSNRLVTLGATAVITPDQFVAVVVGTMPWFGGPKLRNFHVDNSVLVEVTEVVPVLD